MKKIILLLSLIFVTFTNAPISASNLHSTKTETVYICTGNYATKYHSTSECAGLNNCKGQIIAVTLYDAVNKYNRTPCSRCE